MRFQVLRDGMTIHSCQELREALSLVSMSGSCLDFGWQWSIDAARDGWLVRATFVAPDRDTMQPAEQHGRKFHVREGATVREALATAFVAMKLAIEHELLEAFMVAGVRPFDPHGPMLWGGA